MFYRRQEISKHLDRVVCVSKSVPDGRYMATKLLGRFLIDLNKLEGDVFAFQSLLFSTGTFCRLEILGQFEKPVDLVGAEI